MKKKIFTLLTLLATVCSGAWATTETYDFAAIATEAGTLNATFSGDEIEQAGGQKVKLVSYGSYTLGNRFASSFSRKSGGNPTGQDWWIRSGSGWNCLLTYTGNTSTYYLSILNLLAGDKVTITLSNGNLTLLSSNITGLEAGNNLTSEKEYTISAAGHLDLSGVGQSTRITKVVIETSSAETMGAPTIAATGANGSQRTITITPGVGSGSSAATATYYTTDGTDPSSSNGTAYSTPFTITETTTIKAVSYLVETIGEIASKEIEAGTTLQLNAPAVSISSIAENAGVYNPVYSWTSDQSSVIGAPEVTYTYTYTGVPSTAGTSYTPTAAGTLTVTASAAGYTSKSTEVEVTDFSYVKSYYADFSTLTKISDSGHSNITFNNAGCSFWSFDNTFSEKVTLSGFHLAWAISDEYVAGIFARASAGTLTYTGYFPTNSVIYLSCASQTAWYAKYSTSNTVNIAQYNGVYNMTVYVPSSSVATVEIGSTGWATFSDATNILDFANAYPVGLTAYKITGRDGTTVTKSAITAPVAAGTGLLLNGTTSTTYYVPIADEATADITGNLLVAGTGVTISKEDNKTKYVLVANGSAAEFQKIDGTAATVLAGKAYLQFNEVINARNLTFDDVEATGIDTLNVERGTLNDATIYNIAGQRVAQPTKGLYIVNGKKVVVK